MKNIDKTLIYLSSSMFFIGIWAGLTFSTIEFKKYSDKELQLIHKGFVLGWYYHESSIFGSKVPSTSLYEAWKSQKASLEAEKKTIKDE